MQEQNLVVVDQPERGRYELLVDDVLVGHASYTESEGVVTVPHVEVDPARRGNGLAAQLMAGMVADLRTTGRSLHPVCPYAVAWIADNPEANDIVR